jgi:hypothetical protein
MLGPDAHRPRLHVKGRRAVIVALLRISCICNRPYTACTVACITVNPSKMDSLRTLYDMRTLYIVRRSTSSATAMGAVRVGMCGGILSHTVATRAVRRFSRIESPRSRRELKECPLRVHSCRVCHAHLRAKERILMPASWCGRRSSSCLQVYSIPAPWLQHLCMPACACASRSAPKPSPDCRCLQSNAPRLLGSQLRSHALCGGTRSIQEHARKHSQTHAHA